MSESKFRAKRDGLNLRLNLEKLSATTEEKGQVEPTTSQRSKSPAAVDAPVSIFKGVSITAATQILQWKNRLLQKTRARKIVVELLRHAIEGGAGNSGPWSESFEGVVMIADLSGFTRLSEGLAKGKATGAMVSPRHIRLAMLGEGDYASTPGEGPQASLLEQKDETFRWLHGAIATAQLFRRQQGGDTAAGYGAEELQSILTSFFGQMIEIMTKHGGDVLRVAGDAVICTFGSASEELIVALRRAVMCAQDCIERLNGTKVKGHSLYLHIGLGCGRLYGFHVGGVLGRWQYLLTGKPLRQIACTLTEAQPGEAVMSKQCYIKLAGEKSLNVEVLPSGNAKIKKVPEFVPSLLCSDAVSRDSLVQRCMKDVRGSEQALRSYVPSPVLAHCSAEKSGWLAEIRRISVLFLTVEGLGDNPSSQTIGIVQRLFSALQRILYHHSGVVKEFSMDDKGVVLVAGFGLPPLVGEHTAVRASQCAIDIKRRVAMLNIRTFIGVTTGQVFCASVGSSARGEFAMVGDIVNLSARLMGMAKKRYDSHLDGAGGKIMVGKSTFESAKDRLLFQALNPVQVKGKSGLFDVYKPVRLRRFSVVDVQRTITEKVRIFGRNMERVYLMERVQALWNGGAGGTIIIEGEAGMGKSHLLAEMAKEWAFSLGVQVLIGTAHFGGESFAFWRKVFDHLLQLEANDLDGDEVEVLSVDDDQESKPDSEFQVAGTDAIEAEQREVMKDVPNSEVGQIEFTPPPSKDPKDPNSVLPREMTRRRSSIARSPRSASRSSARSPLVSNRSRASSIASIHSKAGQTHYGRRSSTASESSQQWNKYGSLVDMEEIHRRTLCFESFLTLYLPDELPMAPLLNEPLHLALRSTPEVQAILGDTELRELRTREVMLRIVQEVTRGAPVIIVAENAHWMDEASAALLRAVANTSSSTMMILALMRPIVHSIGKVTIPKLVPAGSTVVQEEAETVVGMLSSVTRFDQPSPTIDSPTSPVPPPKLTSTPIHQIVIKMPTSPSMDPPTTPGSTTAELPPLIGVTVKEVTRKPLSATEKALFLSEEAIQGRLMMNTSKRLFNAPGVFDSGVSGLDDNDAFLKAFRDRRRGLLNVPHLLAQFSDCLLSGDAHMMQLKPLQYRETSRMAMAILENPDLCEEVLIVLHIRSQGNPYAIKELALAMQEYIAVDGTGAHLFETKQPEQLALVPHSILNFVSGELGRLSQQQQFIVKVCSVCGLRISFRMLRDVHPLSVPSATLRSEVLSLARFGVFSTVTNPETGALTFFFRSILIMEVAYGMLPFSQRKRLHLAVAKWIEDHTSKEMTIQHYPILIHHLTMGQKESIAIMKAQVSGHRFLQSIAIRELKEALPRVKHELSEKKMMAILWCLPWMRGLCKAMRAIRSAGLAVMAAAKFKRLLLTAKERKAKAAESLAEAERKRKEKEVLGMKVATLRHRPSRRNFSTAPNRSKAKKIVYTQVKARYMLGLRPTNRRKRNPRSTVRRSVAAFPTKRVSMSFSAQKEGLRKDIRTEQRLMRYVSSSALASNIDAFTALENLDVPVLCHSNQMEATFAEELVELEALFNPRKRLIQLRKDWDGIRRSEVKGRALTLEIVAMEESRMIKDEEFGIEDEELAAVQRVDSELLTSAVSQLPDATRALLEQLSMRERKEIEYQIMVAAARTCGGGLKIDELTAFVEDVAARAAIQVADKDKKGYFVAYEMDENVSTAAGSRAGSYYRGGGRKTSIFLPDRRLSVISVQSVVPQAHTGHSSGAPSGGPSATRSTISSGPSLQFPLPQSTRDSPFKVDVPDSPQHFDIIPGTEVGGTVLFPNETASSPAPIQRQKPRDPSKCVTPAPLAVLHDLYNINRLSAPVASPQHGGGSFFAVVPESLSSPTAPGLNERQRRFQLILQPLLSFAQHDTKTKPVVHVATLPESDRKRRPCTAPGLVGTRRLDYILPNKYAFADTKLTWKPSAPSLILLPVARFEDMKRASSLTTMPTKPKRKRPQTSPSAPDLLHTTSVSSTGFVAPRPSWACVNMMDEYLKKKRRHIEFQQTKNRPAKKPEKEKRVLWRRNSQIGGAKPFMDTLKDMKSSKEKNVGLLEAKAMTLERGVVFNRMQWRLNRTTRDLGKWGKQSVGAQFDRLRQSTNPPSKDVYTALTVLNPVGGGTSSPNIRRPNTAHAISRWDSLCQSKTAALRGSPVQSRSPTKRLNIPKRSSSASSLLTKHRDAARLVRALRQRPGSALSTALRRATRDGRLIPDGAVVMTKPPPKTQFRGERTVYEPIPRAQPLGPDFDGVRPHTASLPLLPQSEENPAENPQPLARASSAMRLRRTPSMLLGQQHQILEDDEEEAEGLGDEDHFLSPIRTGTRASFSGWKASREPSVARRSGSMDKMDGMPPRHRREVGGTTRRRLVTQPGSPLRPWSTQNVPQEAAVDPQALKLIDKPFLTETLGRFVAVDSFDS